MPCRFNFIKSGNKAEKSWTSIRNFKYISFHFRGDFLPSIFDCSVLMIFSSFFVFTKKKKKKITTILSLFWTWWFNPKYCLVYLLLFSFHFCVLKWREAVYERDWCCVFCEFHNLLSIYLLLKNIYSSTSFDVQSQTTDIRMLLLLFDIIFDIFFKFYYFINSVRIKWAVGYSYFPLCTFDNGRCR